MPEVKSLLLSMLYEIENFYKDYQKVKVNVMDIEDFLGRLFYIIKYECRDIEFIKREENKSMYKNIRIDKNYDTLKTYANEKILLYSLIKMDEYSIKLIEEDKEWESALTKFIDTEVPVDYIEVLRDFNGWSWEPSNKEITNYMYNIIYQTLKILMEENTVEILRKYNLKVIKTIYAKKYKKDIIEKYLENTKKLIISIYKKEKNDELENQFINSFIECFIYKLKKADSKEEVYRCICEFRYFLRLPYDGRTSIFEKKQYIAIIENVKKTLISKAIEVKLINEICKDEKLNYEILSNLFNLKVIDLNNLKIDISKKGEERIANFYDGKVLENEVKLDGETIKTHKKQKVFKL